MATRVQSATTKKKDQPVKKLVIKNLKEKPKLPVNFEEETWRTLKAAIHAVHKSEPTGSSLEELYRGVENLCSHKMSANLYKNLQYECESHMKVEVNKLIGQTSDPLQYLILINNSWQDHCNQMINIRSIFLYLDRTYVLQNAGIKSIWDMGLNLFRTYIATQPEVLRKTITSLLNLIERERRGETVDKSLLKDVIRMLVSLQIYHQYFEKQFLDDSKQFYQVEGVNYMRETEVHDYLRHVENRLAQELDRVLHYLHSSTRKLLITTTEKELLERHVEQIISKGFNVLMEASRVDDLKRMYQLFSRVNGLDKMKAAFVQNIKQTGTSIVNDIEKEKTMVQELLDFKQKCDIILHGALSSNETFTYGLKEAFESFINSRANKPAEFIAKFIDQKLRIGNKGTSEEELEQLMDKVMVLFRYIHGKDVFEAFYKKDFAKRLLFGKSASIDAEKLMIAKLKSECGSTFTSKLEGMFKDIDLAKDLMDGFKQSPKFQSQLHGNIDLYVNVLTAGYWPACTPVELNLPQQLAQYQDVFKEFFLQKYCGRRLTWQNSLGHCIVKANFPLGKKELALSLFQTVVLLLFNNQTKLTFREVQTASGMERNELKRTLQSLSCGKVRVINKEPKGRDVEEDDTFLFNKDFKHKLHKIKINSIQLKETQEEQQKTTASVMQDRQYQIDAAIVRIMKTRKTLKHSLLVSELYTQLKFPVKPGDLKKRIESLIDREYLERDPQNAEVYNYLA